MKTAIIAVIIAICLYFYGHHVGWDERNAEMQAEIATKNEEARKKEQELATQLNTNATKLQEANNALDQKQSALDRAIRAGRVRLPAAGCVQTNPSATPAPGGGNETSDGSDPETLAAIAALVAEGQRNTQQLNACIDAYNQVKEQVNGQR